MARTTTASPPALATPSQPAPGGTPIPLEPVDGKGRVILPATGAGLVAWINHVFRGVTRGRGDEALTNALFRDLPSDAVGHLAALIERARGAEREAAIQELAGDDGAAKLLIERARAEGHAAGRAEAEAEHATVIASRDAHDLEMSKRRAQVWDDLKWALLASLPPRSRGRRQT